MKVVYTRYTRHRELSLVRLHNEDISLHIVIITVHAHNSCLISAKFPQPINNMLLFNMS